jgi:hypothetical protein
MITNEWDHLSYWIPTFHCWQLHTLSAVIQHQSSRTLSINILFNVQCEFWICRAKTVASWAHQFEFSIQFQLFNQIWFEIVLFQSSLKCIRYIYDNNKQHSDVGKLERETK